MTHFTVFAIPTLYSELNISWVGVILLSFDVYEAICSLLRTLQSPHLMFPSLHNFIFKCQPMYGGERMEQNVWYLSATSFANVCRFKSYVSKFNLLFTIKSSPLWLNANGAMNDILWCLSGTVQCSALTKFLTDKIFDVQNIHLFLCIEELH